MIERFDVLIIGAGHYGLSCAWHMAVHPMRNRVLVVDRGGFADGGSGRNAAGIRTQWGLEFNVRLSLESIEFFEDIERRLDYPDGIELKQEGYLLLAHDQALLEGLRADQALQKRLGVDAELLAAEDCLRLVPGLATDGLAGGAFCRRDGTANPFRYLDALLRAVRRAGTGVRYGTPVTSLHRRGDTFVAETPGGRIAAERVLVCTDWEAPRLLSPLGVDIPVTGMPKEVLVTEPTPPVVGPCVVSYHHDLFVNQVPRGSIIALVSRERAEGDDMSSTTDFAGLAAGRLLDLLPGLAGVNVLRTWAGVISRTPDMQAVLGETPVPGLFVAVSAYKGFMTSPAVGRIMAELVVEGHSNDPSVAPLSPARFAAGDLVPEPLTI